MVTGPLTDVLIEDGKQLLLRLDQSGPPFDAALWNYFSEMERWVLLVSVRNVSTLGPRVFYKTVQRHLLREPKPRQLVLDDVQLAAPNAPVVAAVRVMIGSSPGWRGTRMTRNIVNGILLQDCYVYRA